MTDAEIKQEQMQDRPKNQSQELIEVNLVEEGRTAQPAKLSASLYLSTIQHSLSCSERARMLMHGLMLRCLDLIHN